MYLQRLKDKLGNRSNASSEVEFDDAVAWPVGEPGRGVATIIEMVSSTRLDCILGSAASMRQAVVEAAHHAAHRRAFGVTLADQPAMAAVLADLTLESEAATTLALRLAAAADRAARGEEAEAALLRLMLPAAKHWICKRTPAVIAEALECLGGNGFVEESVMARLYRDAPLNSIWEGSGNVIALDVLRAVARDPAGVEALDAELALAGGLDDRFDTAADAALSDLVGLSALGTAVAQASARRVAERVALALQGSLLLRHSPPAVAEAFLASRLAGDGGSMFGTLPSSVDAHAIIERHRPKLAAG
jgi:putative acyl-CoA dehydrogenase